MNTPSNPESFSTRPFSSSFSWVMSVRRVALPAAQAAAKAFGAEKMNYELLGMGDAHLHWHITPRVSGDLGSYGNHGKGPVWWYPMEKMYSDETRPNPDELQNMKRLLSAALDEILTEGTQ